MKCLLNEECYIVWGTNRVARDFLYVFDDLRIVAQIRDDISEKEMLDIVAKNPNVKIIICDFDHDLKEQKLKHWGLLYKEDYIFEQDLFFTLDSIAIPNDKDCYIWGTGEMANFFLEEGPQINIAGFIDSNKQNEYFKGYPVYNPRILELNRNAFVIVAVAKNREIIEYLEQQGYVENDSFCVYDMLIGQPSRMLSKTIFERKQYDVVCHTMLNHLEILSEGNTRCCCTTFVNQNLGNVIREPIEKIWKSKLHKIMCLSIENRTYSFCDKKMCPLFVGVKCQNECASPSVPIKYFEPENYPKVLVAGYDSSCNLRCETCRNEFYYADGKEKEYIERITQVVRKDYIKNAEFVVLAGDGEVFASKAYEELFMSDECNPQYIRLLTNGTLFNEKNWEKLTRNKKSQIMMTVSIDAASKETYEKIRRGGNFSVLKSNMNYASELRRNGKLAYLRLNFVVQRRNYHEIPLFVEWGQQLEVDEIFFTKILNWGTYSDDEFNEVSMMEKDGVTPKEELVCMLSDEIVHNSTKVDMGTIQFVHKKDYTAPVYNYYIWEIEKRGGNLFEGMTTSYENNCKNE